MKSIFGNRCKCCGQIKKEEIKYYDTRESAELFTRRGDRIFYDPHIGKYYIKRAEDIFW